MRAQVAECQAQIKKEFSTLAVRGGCRRHGCAIGSQQVAEVVLEQTHKHNSIPACVAASTLWHSSPGLSASHLQVVSLPARHTVSVQGSVCQCSKMRWSLILTLTNTILNPFLRPPHPSSSLSGTTVTGGGARCIRHAGDHGPQRLCPTAPTYTHAPLVAAALVSPSLPPPPPAPPPSPPLGNTQAEKMLGALEAKASELAAAHEHAKLELQEQWEQYRAIYEKACSMHQVRGCGYIRLCQLAATPVRLLHTHTGPARTGHVCCQQLEAAVPLLLLASTRHRLPWVAQGVCAASTSRRHIVSPLSGVPDTLGAAAVPLVPCRRLTDPHHL